MDELLVENELPPDTEATIVDFADIIAPALRARHLDEQEQQLLDEASWRPELMDCVLQGRILDDWAAWEAAIGLRKEKNVEKIRELYNWERIIGDYERLFLEGFTGNRLERRI